MNKNKTNLNQTELLSSHNLKQLAFKIVFVERRYLQYYERGRTSLMIFTNTRGDQLTPWMTHVLFKKYIFAYLYLCYWNS